jgi:hypothetical protein
MCLAPTLSSILSHMYVSLLTFIPYIGKCSDGLGVRVEDLNPKGSMIQIPTGTVSFENYGSKFRPWE